MLSNSIYECGIEPPGSVSHGRSTNGWLISVLLRTRNCPDLYLLIRPPKRSFALGRGRIFIAGFVRSPRTLAVYGVAHSLPRGGVGRSFPFTEGETRRHFSYLSGTSRESNENLFWKYNVVGPQYHRCKIVSLFNLQVCNEVII